MRLERLLGDAGATSGHVKLLRKRKSLKWQMLLNRDESALAPPPEKSATVVVVDAVDDSDTTGGDVAYTRPPSAAAGGLLVAPAAVDGGDASFGSSDIELELMTPGGDAATTAPSLATSMTQSFSSTTSGSRVTNDGDGQPNASIGSFTNSLLSHSSSGKWILFFAILKVGDGNMAYTYCKPNK